MKFEWDNEKNHTNLNKHGIDFNTAKELWEDPNRIEIHKETNLYGQKENS